MSTIRALIIDDEPLAHKVIEKYAADLPFLEIVGNCYKATEAYPFLEKGPVDLLFLDINMPRLKGLDFLRTLTSPPKVIITSAYEEYALEGYELRVVDYLLKPFRFDRFLRAVTTAQQSFAHGFHADGNASSPDGKPEPARPSPTDCLFIKVDKKHLQLLFSDIQYLESYGNYVKIYTGKNYHLTARTLNSFVVDLPAEFVQVHKSYILNRRQINYVEGAMVVMTNEQTVPVGKSYRKEVREWFR